MLTGVLSCPSPGAPEPAAGSDYGLEVDSESEVEFHSDSGSGYDAPGIEGLVNYWSAYRET